MMNVVKLLLIGLMCGVFLVACDKGTEDTKKIVEDTQYTIEAIRFEDKRIFIDTEQETQVYYPHNVYFLKTDKPSYLSIKTIEDRDWGKQKIKDGTYPRESIVAVYVNEQEIKIVSKNYANVFMETLQFLEK